MNSPEIQQAAQIWNSLRIPFMILAVLGPVIIVLLVIRYKRIIKGLETKYQTNHKAIEKRIEMYDRIGPKLNDLYCFFSYNGNWKTITPMDILSTKKELDKEIQIDTPIFTNIISDRYMDFMRLCFVSFSGWEHEEKIKSLYELRQEHHTDWTDEWIPYFDTKNVVEAVTLKEKYDDLIEAFKQDLSL